MIQSANQWLSKLAIVQQYQAAKLDNAHYAGQLLAQCPGLLEKHFRVLALREDVLLIQLVNEAWAQRMRYAFYEHQAFWSDCGVRRIRFVSAS